MTDENKIYCCPECNSDDILFLSWCQEYDHVYGERRLKCLSCYNEFVTAQEKKEVA